MECHGLRRLPISGSFGPGNCCLRHHLPQRISGWHFAWGLRRRCILPALFSDNTNESLTRATTSDFIESEINSTYTNDFEFFVNTTTFPNFYSWLQFNTAPDVAGIDLLIGSRILDEEALSKNVTALNVGLQAAIPPSSSGIVYMIFGKGVHDAVPRGGSNAVNPAWRRVLVHFTNSVS